MNTASLPIATPCSLAPISAPHIQNGRLIRTAFVSRDLRDLDATCSATVAPSPCSARRVPLEHLRLVRVAVAVLAEEHPIGADDHDRVAHAISVVVALRVGRWALA